MSWFGVPYSKKTIRKEENSIIRKYGKTIPKINEAKEIESITENDNEDFNEINTVDTNIDNLSDVDEKEDND